MSRWVVIITIVLVGLVGSGNALALSGSGTQEDPWRIESLADFDEFAADPNYWSGFTRLETDVNLAGRTYTTAVIAPDTDNSDYWFHGTAFTGVFDGNDHKITNMTINGGVNEYLGLFGCIEDGQVNNLGLEGGSVSGDRYVGNLGGANGDWGHPGGAISNCYSTGHVSGWEAVGGLVGANNGDWDHQGVSISNCYSTGDVNGSGGVGGLVGANGYGWDNPGGAITNCYSTGDVNGSGCVGGLVGINADTVSNCYSTGDVNGVGDVGGLVGAAGWSDDAGGLHSGAIYNSYSTGDVNGSDCVGGLVGANPGSVSNCYSTGDVSGTGWGVGGLVGVNYESESVSNCYSTGDVSGYKDVGGLVGRNGTRGWFTYIPGDIYNSYSTGSVEGTSNVGGLVGYNQCGDIYISLWDVETSGEPNMCGSQSEYRASGCDPNCGKTTAEMQTKSTFTDAAWDFVEIWLINEGATYPVLRQEIRSDLNGDGGVDMRDFAVFADHWLEGTGD